MIRPPPMAALTPSTVEVWPEKAAGGGTERLLQMRRRGHEEEPPPPPPPAAIEVVSISPSAACGFRPESRRRRARLLHVLLAAFALVFLLTLFYVSDYQPLESASERAKRLHDTKRRQEEAEFSKQLWADVLRRRLQEQAAIGHPRTISAEREQEAAAAARRGTMAAELGVSNDKDDDDDDDVFAPSRAPAASPSSPPVASTPPAAEVAGSGAGNGDAPLRIPPRGFTHDARTELAPQLQQ